MMQIATPTPLPTVEPTLGSLQTGIYIVIIGVVLVIGALIALVVGLMLTSERR
jgi:hypothetical protein